MKLPTPPPPPGCAGADGQPGKGGPACVRASPGPLDYCTLRHGKQQRAVQFADQQLERNGSEVIVGLAICLGTTKIYELKGFVNGLIEGIPVALCDN